MTAKMSDYSKSPCKLRTIFFLAKIKRNLSDAYIAQVNSFQNIFDILILLKIDVQKSNIYTGC